MPQRLSRIQIIMILVFLGAIVYFGYRVFTNRPDGNLHASGTIESVQVDVSPETSGKVQAVLVDEGQTVKTGDPLLKLDDSLLAAQRTVATAQLDSAKAGVQTAQNALQTAQSQYQITLETALAAGKKTRLEDWFSDPDLFQQPGWYYTRQEQIQSAQDQVDLAKQVMDDAQANLDKISHSLEQSDFATTEKRLLAARLAYQIASVVNDRAQNSSTTNVPKGRYNSTHCGTNAGYFVDNAKLTNQIYTCTGDEHLANSGRTLYYDARRELEDSQKAYNSMLNSDSADLILQARADVQVAQERYYSALDFLRGLQTGDASPEVTAAQGAVDQGQAAVEQAQKAVEQAQANLELIDAQMEKLTVYAPLDGAILTRNVEPGEFVQPGAAAITMANLNELTITVYVPEDQYGKISLGQQAQMTVDSFPNEVFSATVSSISDQAEFTPRNVQTVEGRSATVYAVKLKVSDPAGKLKLGMPADVVFAQ